MDTILNIDPVRFAEIMKSFDEISTKNPDDLDGDVEGFNEADFY